MTARTWALAAAVAAVVVVAIVLGRAPERPSGPPGSSTATAADGLAAYAALLGRDGHGVRRLRAPLPERGPRAGETAMVVDGRALNADERRALRRFARGGGRVVLVGSAVAAAATIEGATAVSDGAFLRNRDLGRGDNAARALALAGGPRRPVAFVETVHGAAQRRGLGALPAGVRACLWLLGLAALVGLVARGRRLGPPEDGARVLAPARREHVEALAAALARTSDRGALVEATTRREDR